ncbi:unnamed protein product [Chrysoparadoxa australica]
MESNIQELFVDGKATKVWADEDLAAQLDAGGHLRRYGQNGDEILLDRYDGRWLIEGGLGEWVGSGGEAVSEPGLDKLRYEGLPGDDHSIEVEGLGEVTFLETMRKEEAIQREKEKQQASSQARAAAGDHAGHYGPSHVPMKKTHSSRGGKGGNAIPFCYEDMNAMAKGEEGADEARAGGAEPTKQPQDHDPDDNFVPVFTLPEGVSAPTSLKLHLVIAGTARRTLTSPQLEVLLRVKQAGNESFEFLSPDSMLHAYYQLLKSFGKARLHEEIAEGQRLQQRRQEEREKEAALVADDESAAQLAMGLLGGSYFDGASSSADEEGKGVGESDAAALEEGAEEITPVPPPSPDRKLDPDGANVQFTVVVKKTALKAVSRPLQEFTGDDMSDEGAEGDMQVPAVLPVVPAPEGAALVKDVVLEAQSTAEEVVGGGSPASPASMGSEKRGRSSSTSRSRSRSRHRSSRRSRSRSRHRGRRSRSRSRYRGRRSRSRSRRSRSRSRHRERCSRSRPRRSRSRSRHRERCSRSRSRRGSSRRHSSKRSRRSRSHGRDRSSRRSRRRTSRSQSRGRRRH